MKSLRSFLDFAVGSACAFLGPFLLVCALMVNLWVGCSTWAELINPKSGTHVIQWYHSR